MAALVNDPYAGARVAGFDSSAGVAAQMAANDQYGSLGKSAGDITQALMSGGKKNGDGKKQQQWDKTATKYLSNNNLTAAGENGWEE